ncbi:MAG: uroporphyrinogen decarboxylase family protein [Oscillospiraceae bacterium]
MTSKERIMRMYEHQEADRVPIVDSPWEGTLSRWRREGMPAGVDWRDFFDVDKSEIVGVDITPRYEVKVLEETDRYRISTSPWGVTLKEFKEEDSTPEFLDFTVTTPTAWEQAKARMTVSRDRIDWKHLEANYPKWQAEGRWIEAGFWFGFDVTHSWMSGTETILMALLEEPEWVRDMFDTYLDSCIAHFELLLAEGYRFDAIRWPDDMGYKGTPFFSHQIYRELLQPVHKRAVDWAHERRMTAELHSCGDIMPLIPDILETGIDCLNPIEIKAGMDIFALKEQYGDRLALHGGLDATKLGDREQAVALVERMVPVLKENGGYIFATDHSIPNNVDLETFRAVVDAVKKYGSY